MTVIIHAMCGILALTLIAKCQHNTGGTENPDDATWTLPALKPGELIYQVNSYKVDCTGVGPQLCLQIRKGRDAQVEHHPWILFYASIDGFEWETGYVYTLIVREENLAQEEIPADGSSVKYTLVKLLDKQPDPTVRLHDIWALLSIDGQNIESFNSAERPVLEIQLTSGRVMGQDGCNQFSGKIQEVSATGLGFSPLVSTRMACPDMALPNLFHQRIEKVNGYTIENLILTLLDPKGQPLMTFQKVD